MATETATRGPIVETVFRTRFAIGTTLRRHDGLAVFVGVALGYLLAYLYALGHLTLTAGGDVSLFVVSNPLSQFFRPALGPLSFEPVARVEFGVGTLLFSLNTLIGLGIAVLVGLNLAVTYLAWKQPEACGLGASEASSGLLSGIPALLSGTACCGPIVLIIFGIQTSSALLTAFQWLLPVAVVLLVGSLLWVGRKVNPALV